MKVPMVIFSYVLFQLQGPLTLTNPPKTCRNDNREKIRMRRLKGRCLYYITLYHIIKWSLPHINIKYKSETHGGLEEATKQTQWEQQPNSTWAEEGACLGAGHGSSPWWSCRSRASLELAYLEPCKCDERILVLRSFICIRIHCVVDLVLFYTSHQCNTPHQGGAAGNILFNCLTDIDLLSSTT